MQKLKEVLEEKFVPTFLEVADESAQHAGHLPGAASEGTHLSVEIVSVLFEGKSRVERHQMIYQALDEFFKSGLHALKIKAYAPDEHRV